MGTESWLHDRILFCWTFRHQLWSTADVQTLSIKGKLILSSCDTSCVWIRESLVAAHCTLHKVSILISGGYKLWKYWFWVLVIIRSLWPCFSSIVLVIIRSLWPCFSSIVLIIIRSLWPCFSSIVLVIIRSLWPCFSRIALVIIRSLWPCHELWASKYFK